MGCHKDVFWVIKFKNLTSLNCSNFLFDIMSLCTSGPVPAQLLFLHRFLEVRFWLLVWAHYFTVELWLAREQTSISLSSWPSPTPITGGESEGTSARSGTRSMLVVVVVFSVLRWLREKIYNKWSQLRLPETSFYSPSCNSSWGVIVFTQLSRSSAHYGHTSASNLSGTCREWEIENKIAAALKAAHCCSGRLKI